MTDWSQPQPAPSRTRRTRVVEEPTYGYPGARHPQARNGLGTAALVLGIISLIGIVTVFGGIVLGLLAVIFGMIGMGRARRREATNGGVALAGLITGAIGLVLSVGLVALGLSFFFSHKTQINNLTHCLNQATTDQARTNCQNQFRNQVGS